MQHTALDTEASDVAVALDAKDLPEDLVVEAVSKIGGTDAGASGVIESDEMTSDLLAVDARACAHDWGTAGCTVSLGTLGDTRFRAASDVDDLDADGDGLVDSLASIADAFAPAASDHFDPTPDHFVRYETDASSGATRWVVRGAVTGVERVAYDGSDFAASGDRSVSLTASGLGKTGVALDSTAAEGYRSDVWSVLEDVPYQTDATFDLQDNAAVKAQWEMADASGAAANTDLALDASTTESATSANQGRLGTYRVMQVCYDDDSGDAESETADELPYDVTSVRTGTVTVG